MLRLGFIKKSDIGLKCILSTGILNGKLVLNLGHSPLYRHFYKCLYIEFDTFPRHDIVKASFALLIWLDGNAVKNFTCLFTIR